MMDTLSQAFVVAPPLPRPCDEADTDEERYHDEVGEEVPEEDEEFNDDDSASFYDDEEENFYCSGEEDDVSEGSLDGQGVFVMGTAKYFGGGVDLEPPMMGFSDSFVTDQDASQRVEDLCQEDSAYFDKSQEASGSFSGHQSNAKHASAATNLEDSVHTDVLSFDVMLGKKQPSEASLINIGAGALPQHQLQKSESQKLQKRNSSKRTTPSQSGSGGSSRRNQPSSRNSEGQDLPPTLMPMPSPEHEEEALLSVPATFPQAPESGKTNARAAGRRRKVAVQSSRRRRSHKEKQDQETAVDIPEPPAKNDVMEESGRRSLENSSRRMGSIQARRLSHRNAMDASKANGSSNNLSTSSRRRQSLVMKAEGDLKAPQPRGGIPQRHASRGSRSVATGVKARGGIPQRHASTGTRNSTGMRPEDVNLPKPPQHTRGIPKRANSTGGRVSVTKLDASENDTKARNRRTSMSDRRRSESYKGSLDDQPAAAEEAMLLESEQSTGLRRTQSRNKRLGRNSSRRSSSDALSNALSRSEVVQSSRRASDTVAAAPGLDRSSTVAAVGSFNRQRLLQQQERDSSCSLSHRQVVLQRKTSTSTMSTAASSTHSVNDFNGSGNLLDLMMMGATTTPPTQVRTARARRTSNPASRSKILRRRHASEHGMESSNQSLGQDDSLNNSSSRRENLGRRKSGMLKGGAGRRRITRCKSEPTETLHDIMCADIDEDTVAAMDHIEDEEPKPREEIHISPKSVRQIQATKKKSTVLRACPSTPVKSKILLQASSGANLKF